MGLCELADEDMMGVPAKEEGSLTKEFKPFGYYKDPITGRKKFGALPQHKTGSIELEKKKQPAEWVDVSGQLRFDKEYNITSADQLPENNGNVNFK